MLETVRRDLQKNNDDLLRIARERVEEYAKLGDAAALAWWAEKLETLEKQSY